ncbi:MAG: ABC transporter permease subunit [Gammaproteobacteria bacterium]|nr:ABC transporter permease subunit [Gammaproteobacteria bacterium]
MTARRKTVRRKQKPVSALARAIDVTVIISAIALIAYLVHRIDTVMVYEWHWAFLPEYILRWDEEQQAYAPNLLLNGLAMTFRLALWSMLIASIIGVVMGIMRTASGLFPRMISRLFVELVRNMPPVVFIFVFYFFISSQLVPLFGIDELSVKASPRTLAILEILLGPKELFSNIISGIICLALFEAAYITEIVRAGIKSIDRGQFEAGQSLGLSSIQVLRWVVLPQAIQRVIPPLAGQFITLIKDSSIVSLISIQELTFLAQEVAYSTQYVFEIWLFVAAVYFCICYALALIFGFLERRLAVFRT